MVEATVRQTQLSELPLVAECRLERTSGLVAALNERTEPLLIRGLVADWPVVAAARASDAAFVDYLLRFDCQAIVPVSAGPASLKGRIFYNEGFTGLNADQGNAHFRTFAGQVLEHGGKEDPPLIYMASMDVDEVIPGFQSENVIPFGAHAPIVSLWMGTRSRIAAHNDLPLNIACVVAGKRRFTLFPPDETANLYPGPFELTPAGRPISLVDFHAPDLERFPRFARAWGNARVAELEPGDALFIPSMWWHQVEATGRVNALINYWWRTVPKWMGTPQDALSHAMMTLRDLPAAEKQIWRDIFEHYVFGNDETTIAHIPEAIRGILAPMDPDMARRVRAYLTGRLGR